MALVVALVGAAACLLLIMVASVGTSRSAEAQPRPEGPDSVTNPLKYVMADSPSSARPGSNVKAVAKCPSYHQVISGGFDVHFPTTPWKILDSRPAASHEPEFTTAWVVEAKLPINFTRTIRPFTAYAVCVHESLVPRGDSLYYPTLSKELRANTKSERIAPGCRPSYKAIGGGFRLENSSLYLIGSHPYFVFDFYSWVVDAGSRAQGGKVTAYAVCIRSDLVKGQTFRQAQRPDTNIINASTERCPQDTYLLTGGGATREGDAPKLSWSHIRPGGGSQADPPKDWAAGAKDERFVGFGSLSVFAYAICGRLGSGALGVGGEDGADNGNDSKKKDKKKGAKNNKKQGKHGGGSIKIGKNFVKVGDIRIGKNFVKVGGVKVARGHAHIGPIGAL